MRRLRTRVTRRIAAVAAVGTAALLLLTAGAIENVNADASPICTHGASSLGPILLEDGHVVGGATTPATEACLP